MLPVGTTSIVGYHMHRRQVDRTCETAICHHGREYVLVHCDGLMMLHCVLYVSS